MSCKRPDVSDERQRAAILRYVRENINQLRRYTYGKHIIVRLEKLTTEVLSKEVPLAVQPGTPNTPYLAIVPFSSIREVDPKGAHFMLIPTNRKSSGLSLCN